MKCPKCDGRGKTTEYDGLRKFWCDYKCEMCNGTGEFDPNEVDRFNAVDFIKVMEMVKKPQTNEEWFCNLSTEEKATLLAIQIRLGVEFYRTNDERYQNHDWWVMWLKQPHTKGEKNEKEKIKKENKKAEETD